MPEGTYLDAKILTGAFPARERKGSFCPFSAFSQNTQRVARSVGVVIFIERVIPPATVLLLLGKHDLRVMLIINRPVGLGEKSDAVHGIIVPIKVKVAGIGEVRGMRTGPFAGDVDPAIPADESVEPDLDDFISGAGIPPDAARCGACSDGCWNKRKQSQGFAAVSGRQGPASPPWAEAQDPSHPCPCAGPS